MSSQRYISTSFWDDAWIQELDSDAKLLYMYLLTCPLTNIAGVYKITARRISFDTGLSEELVKALLQSFEKDDKAAHVEEYIILPNWPKHQKTTSKDTKAGIDRVLADLPESILIALKRLNSRYVAFPRDNPKAPYTPPPGPLPSARPTLNSDSSPILKPSGQQTAALVENFSEDEEAELLEIAFEKARKKPGIKNPAGAARKMTRDQDVLEEFKKRHIPPEPTYPPPPSCKCGCDLSRYPGQGANQRRCSRCGANWTYNDDFGAWYPDEPAAPVGDEFDDVPSLDDTG